MSKFIIPSNPPTVNKCIRFPENLVEQVEKAIENRNCTFTAFVIAATKEAVNSLNKTRGN